MICNVQKYRTLLFIKNKVSSQIQMLPCGKYTDPNIKLLYVWEFRSQSKASLWCQTNLDCSYSSSNCCYNGDLCGDEVY